MTAIGPDSASSIDRLYDEQYDRYGTPLEADHIGAFLALSPDGRTVLGPTLLDVARRAKEQLGPGCSLYTIGERAIGRWC